MVYVVYDGQTRSEKCSDKVEKSQEKVRKSSGQVGKKVRMEKVRRKPEKI